MVSRPAETRVSSRLNVNRVRENKIVMTSQKIFKKEFTVANREEVLQSEANGRDGRCGC